MIFQRVNRSDPEKVFIVVQSNGTIISDQVVQWELNSASVNGVLIRSVAASNEWSTVGVADKAIASGAYGLVQVYGYRRTSLVFQTNTSFDTGVPLVPVAGQSYWSSFGSTYASNTTVTQAPVLAVNMASVASSAASAQVSTKIFIRAL